MNQKVIRLDNIRGGNIPSYLFAGIIKTEAITGSFDLSSTDFAWHNVEEGCHHVFILFLGTGLGTEIQA